MNDSDMEENEGRILRNAIRTPDGTVLVSRHRHDYVEHKDANGSICAVDGGTMYLRRIGPRDYEEISIVYRSGMPHSEIREHLCWGTRGKSGRMPLRWIPLKDMDAEHIENILDNHHLDDLYCKALSDELEYRARR